MSDVVTAFAHAGWFAEILLVMFSGCIVRVVALLINRGLRTIKVALRGWPPSHIDADGDWKPEPEKGK